MRRESAVAEFPAPTLPISPRTSSRRLVVYYSAADTVAHVEQQNITATK